MIACNRKLNRMAKLLNIICVSLLFMPFCYVLINYPAMYITKTQAEARMYQISNVFVSNITSNCTAMNEMRVGAELESSSTNQQIVTTVSQKEVPVKINLTTSQLYDHHRLWDAERPGI